ncbi:sigma 54-interacting transcriptional regulator [bacterium]|nr:sigma 54-interacting transcriptional regulator [bacterium]
MRLELGDVTCLGRAEEMDLVLPDAAVSREHARIRRRNLSWILEDAGSRHGTFVNTDRVDGQRPLLKNDVIQVGHSLFLFDSDFDIQNADFSDRSVYFAQPHDETVEVAPVAVLSRTEVGGPEPTDAGMDFVVQLGELFDSARVSFADSLNHACERLAQLFRTDQLVLLLWDTAARRLRVSVAISRDERILADSAVIQKTFHERKAMLISDRPDLAAPPSPDAPKAPASRSILAAPLEIDDTAIGALYLERQELDAYSLLDLRNARAVAKLMAVFIESRQKAEALALRIRYAGPESDIVGTSAPLRRALETVAKLAPTPATVLLVGETGTGKELFARRIHDLSPAGRAGAPYIAVNCSAIPESLFESQLFGHEKGSFTGAIRMQRGLIEQANGGTLFLDEIGEMSLAMQPKLLRFLQERVFTRVGGTKPIRADVRLVTATNRDLLEEVRAGRFREDLYHRVAVIPIELPPLRERRADVAPLADHFLQLHAKKLGKQIVGISAEGIISLEKYDWPGNIRELSNCIERAVLLCDDKVVLPRHLSLPLAGRMVSASPSQGPGAAPTPLPITPSRPAAGSDWPLSRVEAEHIARVLEANGHNQVQAAEVLGIHRNTLRKKIREYDLKSE